MAEVLFILITVYVVYVIHSVVSGDFKKKTKPIDVKPVTVKPKPKPKKDETKATVIKEPKKPVAAKKTTVKKTVVKKASTAKKTPSSDSLRNPETQEVTKVATSYRMTKRWIKEALVTEGLLEKVYKTSELDDAAKAKISKALVKLAKIDKYQV